MPDENEYHEADRGSDQRQLRIEHQQRTERCARALSAAKAELDGEDVPERDGDHRCEHSGKPGSRERCNPHSERTLRDIYREHDPEAGPAEHASDVPGARAATPLRPDVRSTDDAHQVVAGYKASNEVADYGRVQEWHVQ